jgi:hypothetical protein
MAKILAKIIPSTAERVIKLRQTLEWLEIDLDSLDEVYEDVKERKLRKKLRRIEKNTPSRNSLLAINQSILTRKMKKSSRHKISSITFHTER